MTAMVGWLHQFNGCEFEQTPGDAEGQGSLVCCSPWGRIELDTTERLNDNMPTERVGQLTPEQSYLFIKV